MPKVENDTPQAVDAALRYLERGWAVVPITPAGKAPLVAWEAYQHRLPEAADVRHWYKRWPEAGVGIVTGPISRLAVLDIDPRHGGEKSLRDWEERAGPLPPTLEAVTGGGGRHLYFTSTSAKLRNRAALLPGVDFRAAGGLVVAPPSMHASGQRYFWRDGKGPDLAPALPLPRRLVALLLPAGGKQSHDISHWRHLTREGVGEGRRNDTIASLCGHLLWHGVDELVALELLLAWNRQRCRPPLSDDEVAAVVRSIGQRHQRRLKDEN